MVPSATSIVLLEGLKDPEDQRAWRVFTERCEPMLLALVRRSGLRDDEAWDVVQSTCVAFLETYRAGRYDPDQGSLKTWLRGIALNKILEARRARRRGELRMGDCENGTALLATICDDRELEDVFEQEWRRAMARACLQRVRAEVETQTFQAFEMYALQGLTAAEVAARLGITRNAVYISKNRVLRRLRELGGEFSSDL
ncbi:MAG: hypothetical protein AMXMBFR13_00680 [Phycisphaerae bacterium]